MGLDEIVAIARAGKGRSRRVLDRLAMKLVPTIDGRHTRIVRYTIASEVCRSQ